ncbi:hypothetical protein, partial [Xanthomonas fragariae]|uniref:hypothetical protein n=1 Tax=Xanthomonas fragariae TaxID=48664 RepID=UPI001F1FBEDC
MAFSVSAVAPGGGFTTFFFVFGVIPGTGNSSTTPAGRFAVFGPTSATTNGATRLDGTPSYFVTGNGRRPPNFE